jgi:hypothetical protein
MAIDEQKKQDLLSRFSKSTELAITLIEDDSSEGTQVKILHLAAPVNAVGSNPTSEGHEMKVTGGKVNVAAEDIDKFLENVKEQDNILLYKGPMHLDVSKPSGRMVNGQYTITKPAKIWLTATKFSKRGNKLRQEQTQNFQSLVNKMFAGGKTFDLASETASANLEKELNAEGEKKDDKDAKNIEVVANKNGSVDKLKPELEKQK